jgi:hypothetical protein
MSNDINFDIEISGERYIEVSNHSKDEEDDTCIEINQITMNQPLSFIDTDFYIKVNIIGAVHLSIPRRIACFTYPGIRALVKEFVCVSIWQKQTNDSRES